MSLWPVILNVVLAGVNTALALSGGRYAALNAGVAVTVGLLAIASPLYMIAKLT